MFVKLAGIRCYAQIAESMADGPWMRGRPWTVAFSTAVFAFDCEFSHGLFRWFFPTFHRIEA